jgi:signal transduction histidine kinase
LLSIFGDVTKKKELISELTEARNKAEEINKLKTQFFMYMSHELRSPFMGIIGYAQILRDELDNDEYKRMSGEILKTSSRMIDTLSNILELTKLEFDKEEIYYETLDLRDIILETQNIFKEMARAKNLEIRNKTEDEIILTTDKRLITGILNNLVNNAVKFTEKGFVEIKAEKKDGNIVLSVKDTGIGIPQEKQQIIWHEFRQVSEGVGRNYQGNGLGLTIVKKYVEMLDGEIKLQSKLGKGSVFNIIFPHKEQKIGGSNGKRKGQ